MKTEEKKGIKKIDIPKYSLSEELLSAISHGVGVLLSIAALVLCIVRSAHHHDAYAVVSSSLYGATSILLYLMSTLYHSLKVNNAKRVFRIIDHCTIFLLIAGTFTPFCLVAIRKYSVALGWSMFGIIWATAIVGISLTAVDLNKFKKMGMILYLVMGWAVLIAFKGIWKIVPKRGILLLFLGGVVYTIGAIIYGIGKKHKYMHSLFHFVVLLASVLFFFSIFLYVI